MIIYGVIRYNIDGGIGEYYLYTTYRKAECKYEQIKRKRCEKYKGLDERTIMMDYFIEKIRVIE